MTLRRRTGTFKEVRFVPTIALGFAVALSACTDAGSGPGDEGLGDPSADADADADALEIGRVHVVLQPRAQNPRPDSDATDAFEVTARFALVRGLDEEFVRARVDMPFQPEEILSAGQCATEEALWSEGQQDDDGSEAAVRELVLVDAGELEVGLGDARIEVPLSLVPDLLPYMSGVEYVYFADEVPSADRLGDTLTVRAAGGLADELPAFSVEGAIPTDLALDYTAEDLAALDEGALVLRWNGAARGEVALRLTPTLGGEPLGDDVLCVVPDRGQTRLDLVELRTQGFPTTADGVRVTASRTTYTLFDAGTFSGSELLVERRATVELPLP